MVYALSCAFFSLSFNGEFGMWTVILDVPIVLMTSFALPRYLVLLVISFVNLPFAVSKIV